jgi:hypothetical protein
MDLAAEGGHGDRHLGDVEGVERPATHIGVDERSYNGLKWGEFATIGGLKKLGTEKVPPMVARRA